MKILQVSPTFYPALNVGGGVPRVTYELSRKLVENGHEVTVITTDRFQEECVDRNSAVDIEGVRTFYFNNLCRLFTKNKFYFSPKIIRFLKEEIQQFDIVHLQDFRTFQNIAAYYYTRKFDIPYVLQPHGSLQFLAEKQRLKQMYDIAYGDKMLLNASRLITLNKNERDLCIRLGVSKNKIEIVPNGIDLSQFNENIIHLKGSFRKMYEIRNTDKVILYLGRLHKTKGIDLLVESFCEIQRKCSNVWLALVGPDYGFREELEHIMVELNIHDRVIITGMVEDSQRIAALVDADIFVTPSFYGFPLTFVEACACGVPIITTNRGDSLDWIDFRVGHVIEYDRDTLAKTILDVLFSREIYKKFQVECRHIVNNEFNWAQIAHKFEEIYKEVISEV